jgi:hypothetical protein
MMATSGGTRCRFSGDEDECSAFFGQRDIALVPATAPELSTWAMMVVGLVGLGFAGRKSKNQVWGKPAAAILAFPRGRESRSSEASLDARLRSMEGQSLS